MQQPRESVKSASVPSAAAKAHVKGNMQFVLKLPFIVISSSPIFGGCNQRSMRTVGYLSFIFISSHHAADGSAGAQDRPVTGSACKAQEERQSRVSVPGGGLQIKLRQLSRQLCRAQHSSVP
eukprot:1158937-Pelagomonas_calceolata.AAC.12